MPYTAAQLSGFFTTLSRGAQPDATTAAAINIAGTQNTAGQITDAQALATVFNSTQVRATTEVAVATYAFFTGSTPSLAGIDYLVTNPGTGYNTSYYNGAGGTASAPGVGGFDVANRYYNAAINLAGTPGSVGYNTFLAQYGGLSIPQTIATLYNQIIGNASVGATAAANAVTAITGAVGYFQQLAQARVGVGGNVDIATKAIIAAYILEEGIKADLGVYSRAIDQFDTALAQGSVQANSNLLSTYGAGGSAFNPAVGPLGDSQTFNAPATAGATITTAGVAANGVATLAVGANPAILFTGDIGVNTGQLTVAQAGAAVGAADVVNLRFTVQNISTAPSLLAAGVETINVSAELGGGPAAGTTLSLDIQDLQLTTLTLGGNEPVAYSAPLYAFLDGTFSGGALRTVSAAGAGAAVNIDVSSAGAAGAGVSVAGSPLGDTLQFRNFASVAGGAGVDTFIAYTPTSLAAASVITDEQGGEVLGFFGVRLTAFVGQAVTAASLQAGLDAAAAGGAGRGGWFQLNGDTYVVADTSAANTFQVGADSFVRLVGMHNLASSALTAQGQIVLGG